MSTARSIIAVAVAVVSFSACGSNNEVGSGVNKNPLKSNADNLALGRATTTLPPTTAPPSNKVGIGAPTTAPKTTTTPATQAAPVIAIDITINGDGGSTTQMDPKDATVYKNQLVRWTNKDRVVRSIESDTGVFQSGPIAPGASFTYKAVVAGSFNYHDGTRPYAVGTLEVINR